MLNNWINNSEEKEKNTGLLDSILNVLDSAKEDEFDYESEKKKYRDAIVEQNLYDGDTYEDLYEELNGDN